MLWHAATLLREYRGDGHLAALLDAQLSGIEAIVTHCATGRGFTEDVRQTAARLVRRAVGGGEGRPRRARTDER